VLISETTRCKPLTEPSSVSTIPVPIAIEQADPGVKLLDAHLIADPVVIGDVDVKVLIEPDLLGVEGLRAVHV
jgi:hypothetical protein